MEPDRKPKYEHHCGQCLFLGNYDDFDLYFCKQSVRPTVIARFGSGDKYHSGLEFGMTPLRTGESEIQHVLRVAYLIAADMGFLPFTWGGSMELSPWGVIHHGEDSQGVPE